MSLNKILSLAESTIKSAVLFLFIFFHSSISSEETTQYNPDDQGVLSIMYHRFGESKYPSTNIQLDIFNKQLEIIEDEGIKFIHPMDRNSRPKTKTMVLGIMLVSF